MKKEIWLLGVLGLIMVILVGILIFVPAPASENNNQGIPQNNQSTKPQVVEGIQIDSPKSGAEISSPLKITGSVNGGGWAGFEGQVGSVQLLDKNGKEIAKAGLRATTDWMKFPTSFEATLTFSSEFSGAGTLFFRNENPSDMRDKDKMFGLPVVIK